MKRTRRRPRRLHRLAPLAAAPALLVLQGHALVLAVVLAVAGWGGWGLIARSRARRAADATRASVVEACEALASELRAGSPPVTALTRSADVWSVLGPVATAGRYSADVPAALRRAGRLPGAAALAELGAAWQVSQSLGGGLAHAVDRVVETARAELATHRVVASELASAQATARMIATLPVVILVLSDGSGADPWRFLLLSTPGLCCLAAGLGLALIGMWWIDRIISRIQAGEL